MSEFLRVVRLEEARHLLENRWPKPLCEEVYITAALDRVLAEDVVAMEDLPYHPRSTVDGYAVKAADCFGASESIPAFLNLAGEILMGDFLKEELKTGQCMWIPTGGFLPEGADAVVMVEHTERLGEDMVLINRPVGPGDNVIQKGEDCRRGEVVLKAGQVMRAQDLGVAAALGITHLKVIKPLKVGIISTGDELVAIEETPAWGKIRDVNSHVLAAAVRRKGGYPTLYGIVRDDSQDLKERIQQAMLENDILLLSGGSSVGTKDMTLKVLESFPDCEVLFHGISVKPGKPTVGSEVEDKLVIGLPGHPVSALMVFEVLLAPLFMGRKSPIVLAVLDRNVPSQAGRDDFVRVGLRWDDDFIYAEPIWGKAGLIRIMAKADGYIHIPYEKQGLAKGERVKVHLF